MTTTLAGKVAIVTGRGQGVGFGIYAAVKEGIRGLSRIAALSLIHI